MADEKSEIDVFLSYNRDDQRSVINIARQLKERHIKVWLDVEQARPGLPFQPSIQDAVRSAASAAVFIGPTTMGRWQDREVQLLLEEANNREFPVIPVLLPDSNEKSDDISGFLKQHTWVKFRDAGPDDEAMKNLIWGITGVPPDLQKPPQAEAPEERDIPRTVIDSVIKSLADQAPYAPPTFLVGRSAFTGANNEAHAMSEVGQQLLKELGLIDRYDRLGPSDDLIAQYYRVGKSREEALEEALKMSWHNGGATHHKGYKSLIKVLHLTQRLPVSRSQIPTPQLVVTMTTDLCLERALLQEGVRFVRVVQVRSREGTDPVLTVNSYEEHVRVLDNGQVVLTGMDGQYVEKSDLDGLDLIIANGGRRTVRGAQSIENLVLGSEGRVGGKTRTILLYKHLGSQDIPRSTVLTTGRYYEFAGEMHRVKRIPNQIGAVIGETPFVILGSTILDPELLLTYFTLLKDNLLVNEAGRYCIRKCPSEDTNSGLEFAESRLWDKVVSVSRDAFNITLLDEEPVSFLKQLSIELANP